MLFSASFISDWFITKRDMLAGEGTGLLRLHSTYRHDLKIYSSDEGRVQVQLYIDLVVKMDRRTLRYYIQSSVYSSSVALLADVWSCFC